MMSAQRVAACSTRRLSQLLQSNCRISTTNSRLSAAATTTNSSSSKSLLMPRSARFLSTTGSGGNNNNNNNNNNSNNKNSDPFGVKFDDGEDKVGPTLPPKYHRDAATGKLTGDVEAELTPEERKVLNMDPLQRDQLLLKRLVQSWESEEDSDPLTDFARRVRLAKMALNVLGRSVQAQAAKSILEEDGSEFGRDNQDGGFTQSLTPQEFETFQRYMQDQHGKVITEDDVPVHPDAQAGKAPSQKKQQQQRRTPSPLDDEDIVSQGVTDDAAIDSDNPDLSLKWLTSRAQWEIHKKFGEEGPFDDMMPRDLTMTRIVNRKRAKILPRELLHHNNLSLLRRYVSPAGQIMHRVRTRLGARDQRKIAKLVKRARNIGLIPHTGQFVIEDHGNIHEADIREPKPWELELERRGLVVTASSKKQS